MPHIVFGWTTPAVLAGAKTVIRLPASNPQPAKWRAGTLVTAYNRLPPRGVRPVGMIQVTADPVREPISAMPDGDYEAEGWRWLHDHRALLPRWVTRDDFTVDAFDAWRARDATLWVVRFTLVAVALGDQAEEAVEEALAQ